MKDGEMGGARGTYARYEKYQIWVGKPEERRPLGRLRRGWEVLKDTAFTHCP
jgi:hypothetical protein